MHKKIINKIMKYKLTGKFMLQKNITISHKLAVKSPTKISNKNNFYKDFPREVQFLY